MFEMTAKDVLRSQVMAQVMEGKLDQASAASRLGISVRQVKRIKRRLQDEGTAGLLSKKRGKPSNRRTPAEVLAKAVELIGTHYADFGPTLACEKLDELHEIKLSVETVPSDVARWFVESPARSRHPYPCDTRAPGPAWRADPDRRFSPRLVRRPGSTLLPAGVHR